MKHANSLLYSLLLLVADSLALVAAFVGAYILRVSLSNNPFPYQVSSETYLGLFLTTLPFWLIIFGMLGLYRVSVYERRFAEFGRLLTGSFIGLLFVIFWDYVTVDPIFPAKLVPVYGFLLGFLFLLLIRTVARILRRVLYRYNVGITHVLLVGNTAVANELVQSLKNTNRTGYHVIGTVGDKRRALPADFGSFQEALENIGDQPIHGIIQTELYADEIRNREILDYAQTNHISYRFIPGNSELFVGNIDVVLFQGNIPVIAVHQTALLGWGRILKRLFDIAAGSLALIIISPLLFVLAMCNKLINGHVLFTQKRLTRFNQSFKLYKFQTVLPKYNGLSPEEAFAKMGKPELIKQYRENGDKLKKDPRYGKFGNFLRATSLDELPQLFNVVRGDISLVGPRALVPSELDAYGKKHAILSVKSGLTGLAQVSGRRNISFEERRKLDLYYVQNWSFWLDIIILFRTVRVLLNRF